MYQRLGLEDDLVDPSNTLLREGPVLKISFRRIGPMERYLFLVGGCWGDCPTLGREVHGPSAPGSACLASTQLALQDEQGQACFSILLYFGTQVTWDKSRATSRPQEFLTEGVPRHALGSNRVRI